MIYFQKPSDHADGIVDDILQHVPGVINATSSAIGLVADRFFPICGGGSSDQRADSSNGASNKRAGDKRCRSPSPNTDAKLIFRGKPLAMDLYKPKRRRLARCPKPNAPCSRKSRNVELKRDAKGHFAVLKSTPPAQATESSTTDTTRTPAQSKLPYPLLTEPVSPAPPSNTTNPTNQVVEADGQPTPQSVVLDVNSPMIHSLTFPMPTAEELASFLYSTYIVPKLTESPSFFLCREQFYHKYYHAHLISFFQSNLGTTCMSYSQVDTMIFAALHLLGFN